MFFFHLSQMIAVWKYLTRFYVSVPHPLSAKLIIVLLFLIHMWNDTVRHSFRAVRNQIALFIRILHCGAFFRFLTKSHLMPNSDKRGGEICTCLFSIMKKCVCVGWWGLFLHRFILFVDSCIYVFLILLTGRESNHIMTPGLILRRQK